MEAQRDALLRAIAISSLQLPISDQDRQGAFTVLQDLKHYPQRLSICLSLLKSAERQRFGEHDITTAVKLLALEIVGDFLQTGYATLNDSDRLALRQSILQACQIQAAQGLTAESRILGKKLAAVLEGLILRDFPQRWTTMAADLFAPGDRGGLWHSAGQVPGVGVSICLETLKLVAEDCTDSVFNAKISTTRRNDVLIGLNEVSNEFLPKLSALLEQYPVLQQAKTTLHAMHQYLRGTNRTTAQMTPDEATAYRQKVRLRDETAQLLADTLVTLERFCVSMPVTWMQSNQHDFIAAMLHLLRERQGQVQIRAVECLEMLCSRGKLESDQWMRLINELPAAVQVANQVFAAETEQRASERAATGSDVVEDALALQIDFHRALSRMLANVIASHLSHISTNKHLAKRGPDFANLSKYLQLLVEILHHPSGRVLSEQVNMWVSLLRDPQIVKTQLLDPFLQPVLTCYMDHMVRIRWEDVENETHPQTKILEASFDDEEDFDTWMNDLRSKSSLLFKNIGHVDPKGAAVVLKTKVLALLSAHGSGQPLNFLEPSNNQLTQKSDAVLAFEALQQPLDNTLNGIPTWALDVTSSAANDPTRKEIQAATRAALLEIAQALVVWNPTYLWLKFRRAALLEPLKYIWKYDPSTLLQGVDSLLRYLGLPDEWSTNPSAVTGEQMSGEIVGLKKKSGVTLVAVSKRVPHHLVPWLSQLSEATRSLLSSDGLIPLNQMHLYEFLSCVATAVDNPVARSNFISDVLSNAIETLESAEIQQMVSSVPALLTAFGISQATDAASVTNPDNVQAATSRYNKFFNSLNRLLSVGRRCNEASRKRLLASTSMPLVPTAGFGAAAELNFADEGPLRIQELAVNDPFVPIWPRILPTLLQILETVLSVWKPEHQAELLQNPFQRYLYAISDDEVYLAKAQDGRGGGVFGEGGTAGSVITGTDRRDVNLVPKWSGWFNELRITCFQMLGLLSAQRVMFAPEISSLFPRIVSTVVDPMLLKSMEHRHITHYLKHVIELLLTSCPSTMYATHLAPIVGPAFEHMRFRLDKTWLPVVAASGEPSTATKALKTADAPKAAALAAQDGDAWFSWYYGHAGLFVGDIDDVTAEGAVEKHRVDLGRAYSDVLQVAFALKGEWALVLAKQAKEEQAAKKNDPSKLTSKPSTQFFEEGAEVNADGTPKTAGQAALDARRLQRINKLCHFLLLENEQIAGNLTLTIIQCLGYPDAYTCRRTSKICHRLIETVAWAPQYTQLLGQQMFTQAIKNIVTEPKWMVGMEWDMINGTFSAAWAVSIPTAFLIVLSTVVRDIYCRLVLGQTLQPGGQGAGQQLLAMGLNTFEQAKTADRPLLGGGVLSTASDLPRQVLASLPGISPAMVREFEDNLKQKRSAKDQKDFIRDLLRQAADNLKDMNPSQSPAGGVFDRAIEEESLLHANKRAHVVPDLPGKLVTHSQQLKASRKENVPDPSGLSTWQL